jgi:hypothetical protein
VKAEGRVDAASEDLAACGLRQTNNGQDVHFKNCQSRDLIAIVEGMRPTNGPSDVLEVEQIFAYCKGWWLSTAASMLVLVLKEHNFGIIFNNFLTVPEGWNPLVVELGLEDLPPNMHDRNNLITRIANSQAETLLAQLLYEAGVLSGVSGPRNKPRDAAEAAAQAAITDSLRNPRGWTQRLLNSDWWLKHQRDSAQSGASAVAEASHTVTEVSGIRDRVAEGTWMRKILTREPRRDSQ